MIAMVFIPFLDATKMLEYADERKKKKIQIGKVAKLLSLNSFICFLRLYIHIPTKNILFKK